MTVVAVRILVQNLSVLVLAAFTGYLVISKVPNTLHTPLMSGTNAVHGIVVLGGIIVLGLGVDGWFTKLLLVIAIAFGTINVVGGFLVTDRMLEMFKSKPKEQVETSEETEVTPLASSFLQDENFIAVLYIVAFSLFISA